MFEVTKKIITTTEEKISFSDMEIIFLIAGLNQENKQIEAIFNNPNQVISPKKADSYRATYEANLDLINKLNKCLNEENN